MKPAASSIVDWEAIDTVLVDMDGTLLDLAFDTFSWRAVVPQRYARLHGPTVPAALATLAPRFEARIGTLEWYCLDHWARDLDLGLKTFKYEHREHIRFLPGAQEFLASMRARRERLSIVTNAHRDTFAVQAERTGVDRLVDSVVCIARFRGPEGERGGLAGAREARAVRPGARASISYSRSVRSPARAGLRVLVTLNGC